MPTCPNCGEIVMEGDPYCSHCGTTLRWDRQEEEYRPPRKESESPVYGMYKKMVDCDLNTDERFELFSVRMDKPGYLLDEIRDSIHAEEKLTKSRFIMVFTDTFPEVYIFLRRGKYCDTITFERCYMDYDPGHFDPNLRETHYIYERLYADDRFRRKVEEMVREGFDFKEVRNSDLTRSKDDLSVMFTNGYIDRIYHIDDDLNFEKSLELLNIKNLYEFNGNSRDKKRLLAETLRVKRSDGVKFMKASLSDCVAFKKMGRDEVIIYDYDLKSSRFERSLSCTEREFEDIYSLRYSFFD